MKARSRLTTLASWLIAVATDVSFSAPVVIEWATVTEPGNAADTKPTDSTFGFGAVSATFRIAKYEFTNQQYADFLNSVGTTDTYSLYSASMESDARGGITRSGVSGSYTYAVKTNMGDKPVNYVSWFDAARVSNWLMNGATGSSSTETGAYTLVGGQTSGNAPAVNPGAKFFIPTEGQWYKAAYYKGGNTNAGYWTYATQSDTAPVAVSATTVGDGTSGGVSPVMSGNFANFNTAGRWNGQNGNVTTVGTNGGQSAYGTFDMSGNVWEWNDLTGSAGSSRGLRGGFWSYDASLLSSYARGMDVPSYEISIVGFRLAAPVAVPEPSTIAPLAAGLVFGCWQATRRRSKA
jgi:sulfatase modifying factor 1